jgi:CCR4-NOT transcription complex subunit 7/8
VQIGFQDVSLRAFTAALFASRVVAPESVGRVRWVAFGGLYHFGFLLKILTGGKPLPETHQEFSAMLAAFLGRTVFDARYVASKLPMGMNLGGDLSATAALLLDAPEGRDQLWQWEQAGEKGLAACQVFMRTVGLFFAWHGVGMHASRIHGLH